MLSDKNTPVGTAELVKTTESKTEPPWMSMARQKQRSLKEDRTISEHSIVNQDSEKQNKDRAEVIDQNCVHILVFFFFCWNYVNMQYEEICKNK